nr:MAG TPA: hypothetical protein [Bacteriophage sp.]
MRLPENLRDAFVCICVAFSCDLFSAFLQFVLDIYGNTVYNMTIEINKQQ